MNQNPTSSVLITRPLTAGRQLASQVNALGLQAITIPLYTFVSRQPAPVNWQLFTSRTLAIFTSPRSVDYGVVHIPARQKERLEFVAIGPATAKRLQQAGYEVALQASAGFTSEDLLQMPGLSLKPGEAIIFTAPGGRETLYQGLQSMGWKVIKSMVYERVPVTPAVKHINALKASGHLISVWTSISALERAQEYFPEAIWTKIINAPALVISARIQHDLQQRGAGQVILADGPDNRSLLKGIRQLTRPDT